MKYHKLFKLQCFWKFLKYTQIQTHFNRSETLTQNCSKSAGNSIETNTGGTPDRLTLDTRQTDKTSVSLCLIQVYFRAKIQRFELIEATRPCDHHFLAIILLYFYTFDCFYDDYKQTGDSKSCSFGGKCCRFVACPLRHFCQPNIVTNVTNHMTPIIRNLNKKYVFDRSILHDTSDFLLFFFFSVINTSHTPITHFCIFSWKSRSWVDNDQPCVL